MKKYKVLFALACVVLLVVGSMAPALAAKGAVEKDLLERPALTNVVGKVIANTTADGRLIVQVIVHKAAKGANFNVYVKINGPHNFIIDVLSTNQQGNGIAHAVRNLADFPASTGTINIQVVLLEQGGAGPDYATVFFNVPKKKG